MRATGSLRDDPRCPRGPVSGIVCGRAACAGRRSAGPSSRSSPRPTATSPAPSSSSAAARSTRARSPRPCTGRSTSSRSSACSATATRADGREEFHVLPAAVHGHLHCIGVPHDVGDRGRRGGRAGRVAGAAARLRGRRHAPVDRRAMRRLHGVPRDGGHQERRGTRGRADRRSRGCRDQASTGARRARRARAWAGIGLGLSPSATRRGRAGTPARHRRRRGPGRHDPRVPGARDRRCARLLLPAGRCPDGPPGAQSASLGLRVEGRRLVLPLHEGRSDASRTSPGPTRTRSQVSRRSATTSRSTAGGWTRPGSAMNGPRPSRAASTAAGSRHGSSARSRASRALTAGRARAQPPTPDASLSPRSGRPRC